MTFLSPIQHLMLITIFSLAILVKSSLACSSTLQPQVNLCGNENLSLTSKKRAVSIKSGKSQAASHIHCDWKIFIQDPESCQPVFECDQFNMTVSPNCNQNYLELVDTNDKVKVKFCGFSHHLKYKLKDTEHVLEVKSRALDSNSYFDCQVLCPEEPEHDQDVSIEGTVFENHSKSLICIV